MSPKRQDWASKRIRQSPFSCPMRGNLRTSQSFASPFLVGVTADAITPSICPARAAGARQVSIAQGAGHLSPIGRESWRERGGQYVYCSVGSGTFNKKKNTP